MNKLHFIYALVDPRTDEVRYVGKTIDIKRRMRRHRNIGRSENPSLYRDRWIQSLMDDGLDFIVWILESCDDSSWADSEKKWIKLFKDEGCKLTNLAEGGTGGKGPFRKGQNRGGATPGRKKPAGFGEKISKAQKEYISNNPEAREIRRKNGERNKGRKHSLETREKVSKASKSRWESSDYRSKMNEIYEDPIVKNKMLKNVAKAAKQSVKNRVKLECKFCGRKMPNNVMKRHLEVCIGVDAKEIFDNGIDYYLKKTACEMLLVKN